MGDDGRIEFSRAQPEKPPNKAVPDRDPVHVSKGEEHERIEGEDDYSLQEIQFVNVQRFQGLELRDGNMFVLGAGITEDDVFGAEAAGTIPENAKIRQGVLEQSNVNLTEEMTTMLQTQRMYQMASRALTSSDTMMGLANSLRA